MLLPIGDAPRTRTQPWTTYALIALNLAVYLFVTVPLAGAAVDPRDPAVREYLEALAPEAGLPELEQRLRAMSRYDLVVFRYGYRPAAPDFLALWTSLFLHGGLLHLLGNMIFLWTYGANVEARLGPPGFVAAYLACGVLASLAHALLASGSPIPTIGASGAISGVLGLYFLWFPRNTVRLLLLFPFWVDVFVLPARLVLGIYVVFDNILPLLVSAGSGVAYGAHLGGFAAGLLGAWAVGLWQRRPVGGGSGADPEAARALETVRQLRAEGRTRLALHVVGMVLRGTRDKEARAAAHAEAGWIWLEDLRRPVEAYQHFLTALDLNPPVTVLERARAGVEAIDALHRWRIRPRSSRYRWG